MAESAELNILLETGADFVMYKTIRDDQENPVDLTGASISSHLREFAEAADYFEFACMHNGPGGKVTITMPHETTAQIAFASGVYDVKVVLADGFTTYTLHGDAVIREGVTKFYDGKVLFMVGIGEYDALPEVGNVDRLYFCYEDRKIYRWNGMNYVATSVGNGIQKIEFVEHSSPFTDTYRITYDDGTTWDYQITTKGIESIELIASEGNYITGTIDTYRIWFNTRNYYDYQVKGGRISFMLFDVDFETGYLTVTDETDNLTWSISESTGMLSYSY